MSEPENTNPSSYYLHDYSAVVPRWILVREALDISRDCEYTVYGFRPEEI